MLPGDVITVPLFFSPPPPRAIIPTPTPSVHLKSRCPPLMVRRSMFQRSHEKIGDCEQSSGLSVENGLLATTSV